MRTSSSAIDPDARHAAGDAMPEICVYALAFRGTGRIGVRGIAGERLRAVRVGAIDAIIGHIRTIPKPTEHNLRKYARIISALWRRTPALLPARFGTSVGDLADLEVIVGARERTLRRNLRTVRNRAQMTIRFLEGSGIRDQELKESAARSPILDPRSPGSSYLHARAGDAQRAREVPGSAPFRDAVRPWVRAERVEKRGGVATIYHLVPRASADRYRAALERAANAAKVRMLVSGPWPPYAFADSW
jgi:hypothetical protein